MKRRTGITLAILALAVLVWGECRERAGARDALLREDGRQTDSAAAVTDRRISAMAAREVERESTLARTETARISAQRTVSRLKARLDSTLGVLPGGNDSLPPSVIAQFVVRDSVIRVLETIITGQTEQLTIYRAMVLARDSIMADLTSQRDQYRDQRDAWQKKSARRFTCGVGPGLTVSLGGRSLGGATVACIGRL